MNHHPCNLYCLDLIFFFLPLLINILKISYRGAPVPCILMNHHFILVAFDTVKLL